MYLSRRDFLKVTLGTAGILILNSTGKASADSNVIGMSSKAVLVDTSKCIGCWSCYSACKQAHNLPEAVRPDPQNPPRLETEVWSTLSAKKIDNEWHFAKRQCMHCQNPACVEACIVGALQKTLEGPVIYYSHKCIGCRYCMVACPFGVPNFEWEDRIPWVRKCDFCADRMANGMEPACISNCPTGAIKFGERDELVAEAHGRIGAEPEKYVDHVYGEKEIGGTSWLYLTTVPFEKLGFEAFGSEPMTVNAARAMGAVPLVLLGVTAVMTGVYWLTKRQQKLSEMNGSDKRNTGVMK